MKTALSQTPYDEQPEQRQSSAADPMLSRWVGASAGTGKTKVLVDRVLRLMLPRKGLGLDSASAPEKILCITYTKAAAAEMSNRIYAALSIWAVVPDTELDKHLTSLLGYAPDDATRLVARRLFARTLDAPGGLKIMTIHSFCQSVLKRFPLEAGVAPHFQMMDESESRVFLTDALHSLIAEARNNPQSPLADAFSTLALHQNSDDMAQLMGKVVGKRHRLLKTFLRYGDAEGQAQKTVAALYQRLGADQNAEESDFFAEVANINRDAENNLRRAAIALQSGGKKDLKKAAIILHWLSLTPQLRLATESVEDYFSAFFNKDGDLYKSDYTKAAQAACADLVQILGYESKRLKDIRDRLQLWRLAKINAALLVASADMIGRYTAYKRRTDRLDFDDLILKTAALLGDARNVSWVLFKLDEGIDHILLDEAQDTSPEQWQVARAIADEFFSGLGKPSTAPRTLFVVGDEKQSIFSFQGADPAEFARMRHYFVERAAEVQDGLDVFLEHSFRSSAAVLQTVDAVFADPQVRAGVVADIGRAVKHLPQRAGDAGLVEIWPVFQRHDAAETEAWDLPTTIEAVDDPVMRLARHFAATVKGWIDTGEKLESKDRAIRAGDIMVLVQRRGALVEGLIRALKDAGVPVAGIDRMTLTEEAAVEDLLAVADCALQPLDDLTLAAVLKSPFVGLGEDDLMLLCAERSGSVMQNLIKHHPRISDWIQDIIARAEGMTPYEFFAGLLLQSCPADAVSGRRALASRLGPTIHDPLEEFLSAALAFEQNNVPSLQGFVQSFRQGQAEIKREQEGAKHDQVRILTVHGSKGLQAPIVFLADAGIVSYDHPKGRERLLWTLGDKDGDILPLWSPRAEFDVGLYATAAEIQRQKQDEEYRRLLYVAMTRAEDRLYVAACRKKNKPADHSWYRIIERLVPQPVENIPCAPEIFGGAVPDDSADVPLIRRFSNPQTRPPRRVSEEAARNTDQGRKPLPAWAQQLPRTEPMPPQPLSPSRPDEDDPAALSPLAADSSLRFKRGLLIHRVLQFLPDVPMAKQEQALAAYLSQAGLNLSAQQQQDLRREIFVVMRHPDFAPIFGPGSKAEVPLIGLAKDARVMAGQIDRLLIRDHDILIVDYKTNRPPPRDAKDVAPQYLKQMAAYVGLLRNIYPQRRIQAALLWTDGPVLMPLTEEILDPFIPSSSL